MGAMDFLKKKAAAVEPKPKKGSVPVLEIANTEENRDAMKTIIEQKAVEKTAEGMRKQAESVLRPQCLDTREKHCMNAHEFHSSVKVKCGDVGPITFVTQQRYSIIAVDKEEELKKAFGDKYDQYFKTNTEIKLTDKGMKLIEALLPKLQKVADEVCGHEDAFSEIFQVEQDLEPTEQFHQDRVLNAETAKITNELIKKDIIRPQSSSFNV